MTRTRPLPDLNRRNCTEPRCGFHRGTRTRGPHGWCTLAFFPGGCALSVYVIEQSDGSYRASATRYLGGKWRPAVPLTLAQLVRVRDRADQALKDIGTSATAELRLGTVWPGPLTITACDLRLLADGVAEAVAWVQPNTPKGTPA